MNSWSFHITEVVVVVVVVVVISIVEIHFFFCTIYALSFCNDSTYQVISEVMQQDGREKKTANVVWQVWQ